MRRNSEIGSRKAIRVRPQVEPEAAKELCEQLMRIRRAGSSSDNSATLGDALESRSGCEKSRRTPSVFSVATPFPLQSLLSETNL